MTRPTGGCACSAIRYTVEADPIVMMNCHCRDCQRASGSAYAAIVVVPREAVQIVGELQHYAVTGGSGKLVKRGFCPSCGSQVAISLEKIPGIIGLHAGSLDDPTLHTPTAEVWTESAQPWDRMLEHTEKYPQGRLK